jgi:hypothetical protein
MDGKIEQRVCIKFCVKLGKSLEMLRGAFGEHSLSWTAIFEWHSRLRPVECQLKMTYVL